MEQRARVTSEMREIAILAGDIRVDLAVAFLLFCDAVEDDVWCHTVGEGVRSHLVIHRGPRCEGDEDRHLGNIVKALMDQTDAREAEEEQQPQASGYLH